MASHRWLRFAMFYGGALFALWLVFVLGLWCVQDVFVFPGAYMMRRMDVHRAESLGMTKVSATTSDGVALDFLVSPPRAGLPVIVFFHGNAEVATDSLPWMKPFIQKGYGFVMASYRGYDGNAGHPSEAGLIEDGRTQLAWAMRQWSDAPIVLWGESLGSGVAVALGSETHVSAFVLDSPFTSIREIAQRRYPFVPVGLLLRNPFDSLARIAKVDAPALVLVGGRDALVPPDMGKTLVDALDCARSRWVVMPEYGHVVQRWDRTGDIEREIFSFLTIEVAPREVSHCIRYRS